jgi:hypothetical protein
MAGSLDEHRRPRVPEDALSGYCAGPDGLLNSPQKHPRLICGAGGKAKGPLTRAFAGQDFLDEETQTSIVTVSSPSAVEAVTSTGPL